MLILFGQIKKNSIKLNKCLQVGLDTVLKDMLPLLIQKNKTFCNSLYSITVCLHLTQFNNSGDSRSKDITSFTEVLPFNCLTLHSEKKRRTN